MKKLARVFVAFLLLLLIGWFSVRHWRNVNEESTGNEAATPTSLPSNGVARSSRAGPIEIVREIGSNVGILPPPNKETTYREGLKNLNHVPIEYYGIVVDETGQPLPDTQVKWSVAYKDGFQEGHKTGKVATDAQGRFAITGVSGKSLSVFPERTGYRFVATNGGAIYSHLWSADQRHSPNPTNPVRLTMWRIKAGEKLFRLDRQFKVSVNQAPIFLNLVKGTIAEKDADIKLTIVRSPGTLSKQSPADWSLQIEVVDGGILQVPFDVYRATLEAPEGDYQSDWQIKMTAGDRNWFDNFQETFFMKSRRGAVHSKIKISFHVNSEEADPAVFVVQGLINANHSRNWDEESGEVIRIGR